MKKKSFLLAKSLFLTFLVSVIFLSSCFVTSRIAFNKDYEPVSNSERLPIRPEIQRGHSDGITDADWYPSGEYFVTVSTDQNAYIWNKDGKIIRKLDAYIDRLQAVKVNPVSGVIAIGGKSLNLYDPVSGELIWTESCSERGHCTEIEFSLDGRYLASSSTYDDWINSEEDWSKNPLHTLVSAKGWLRIYDLEEVKPIFQCTTTRKISDICFSSDGDFIYASTIDGKILKYSFEKNSIVNKYDYRKRVRSMALSPDGQNLAIGTVKNRIEILNTHDFSHNKIIAVNSSAIIDNLSYNREGSLLLTSIREGDKGIVVIIDPVTNKIFKKFPYRQINTDNINAVWSPDEKTVLINCGYFWNPLLFQWEIDEKKPVIEIENPLVSIAQLEKAERDGSFSLATNSGLFSFDLNKEFSGVRHSAVSENTMDIAWNPDYSDYVLFKRKGGLNIFDGNTNKQKLSLGSHYREHWCGNCTWSNNGKFVASSIPGEDGVDGEIILWDAVTGKQVNVERFKNISIDDIMFSPDDKYLIFCGHDGTYLDDSGYLMFWDIEKWEKKREISDFPQAYSLSIDPDGEQVYVGHFYQWNDDYNIGCINTYNLLDLTFAYTYKGEEGHKVRDLAVSPDGKNLVYGTTVGTVHLVDLSKRSKPLNLPGKFPDIASVEWSGNGEYIIAAAVDGLTRIWRLDTLDFIDLLLLDNGEWFVFTEEGHFDCSSKGSEYVNFVQGLDLYRSDQFWDIVFTPGLIQKFMANEELPAIALSKAVLDIPEVILVEPGNGILVSDSAGEVEVEVMVTGKANGVGDVFLYHNGRALTEKSRGLKRRESGKTFTFTLKLVTGNNMIQAAAYDQDSLVEGRSDIISVLYEPPEIVRPDIHILAFGVSDYQDSGISLVSPRDDAREISELFSDIGDGFYDEINTHVLIDKEVRSKNIINAFSDLVDRVTVDDTVILFFAGHGLTEDDMYYFFPYDADITDLAGTCISVDEIGSFLERISAGKVALFFDTCQSGGAAKGLGQIALARGLEERKVIADLAKQKGIVVFAAAGTNESAYEISELGNGIFTHSLLSLVENEKNKVSIDGYISIGKLLSEAEILTRSIAFEYLNVKQNPIRYSFGEDFFIGKMQD